jgi:subtilisin family serine protease
VVVAAGNYNANADTGSYYPVKYPYDNIVAVAATDNNDKLAGFSNWGPTTVDIAAPGVNILSTNPGKSYGTRTGTSMATPHVTGALSLIWALRPEWNYKTVIAQLLNSADRIPSLAGKVVSGRLNIGNAVKVPPRGSPLPTLSQVKLQEVAGTSGGKISLAELALGPLTDGGIGAAFVERAVPLRAQAVAGSEVLLPAWMAEKPQGPVWSAFELPFGGPRFTTPSSSLATVTTVPGPLPRNTMPGSAGTVDEEPDTSALDELFSGPLDDLISDGQW